MTSLEIVQGSHEDYPLQCWNRGAQTAPAFGSTDVMTAYVYRGQSESSLFAPTVAWYTAGNTQTGYDQGQVLVTVSTAQAATLEAGGEYTLIVWRTPSGGSETTAVWRGTLAVLPAAGSATQAVAAYCQLADMLLHADWIRDVQGFDTDREGFYAQRLEARRWLDDLIVRAWRGTSAAYFGDAGRSAQFWLGSWVRRTPLRSYWLLNQLAGGFVQTATVTAPGTGFTSTPTVTAPAPPAGTGNQAATLSATLNGTGGIGSIYVNTQGLGYTPGSTLTPTISGGGGSGATATASVSTGVLMLRPDIVRACAWKAISYVGRKQLGRNNAHVGYGQYWGDQADALALATVAELDLNGDGIADLPIPLNSSNTMFT